MKTIKILLSGAALIALTACNDADIASRNLSKAADQFEVNRRVVFFNGITDKILLEIIGRCSLGNKDSATRLSVTCKLGENSYKKHFLGLSDNVSFFAEHLQPSPASVYHYRVVFKPQALIPDVDLRMSGNALLNAVTPDSSD